MQSTNLASIFINYLIFTVLCFTQISSVFTSKQNSVLYFFFFFITRPMNCFHAENAHFFVHFLTCEEGFIAFLNISIRQVKKCKISDIGWLVFSRSRFCLVYPGTLSSNVEIIKGMYFRIAVHYKVYAEMILRNDILKLLFIYDFEID